MAECAERWLADSAGQWRPATLVGHRYGIKGHILPHLGEAPAAALTAEDVAEWFAALPCAPGWTCPGFVPVF
ncbi:MAG: hypothetical protein QM682_06145 [Paracoccus sp. (in: a-proteobacteria)]|uniref:hypothetical protein n=1 Tax=Paracoccus sp. TaxID=267 RepID=UPI0039E43C03